MSAATWPAPNVRRGFRRLYLILAVPWLLAFAIKFAIAADDYVHANAAANRLAAEMNANTAPTDIDEALRL
jgi:hypothetical protein